VPFICVGELVSRGKGSEGRDNFKVRQSGAEKGLVRGCPVVELSIGRGARWVEFGDGCEKVLSGQGGEWWRWLCGSDVRDLVVRWRKNRIPVEEPVWDVCYWTVLVRCVLNMEEVGGFGVRDWRRCVEDGVEGVGLQRWEGTSRDECERTWELGRADVMTSLSTDVEEWLPWGLEMSHCCIACLRHL
jgi:hypothetical protein